MHPAFPVLSRFYVWTEYTFEHHCMHSILTLLFTLFITQRK